MYESLTTLPQLGTTLIQSLTVLGVCSVRLFVILYLFPPTADGILQGVVRNGIVMLFSSFIAYGQPASLFTSLSGTTLVVIGLREAGIGLLLGFAASTVFWVAESAGTYVDDLTGYNNVQITNPMREEQSTPTGTLLAQVASVAFWTFGGMTFLLGALYESYHWWPLTASTPVPANVLESFALQQTDSLMQTTAKLAAPMMLMLLLVDFAFGFAAKSAQKLDLMTLSQPVKGALTVLMLALFVGIFVDQVRDQLVLSNLGDQLRTIAGVTKK
ncbi:type III secretion system export apparatus subunit SctT [Paraburkholderia sp. 22099]|jgi:type III secretion protein T|uniref:Type III secretion protein T n=1 Tax=Paraburkholderia terricola TaxID=169427 RepID=A0A1M6MQ94_9BURK|nr:MULTISPECIES: type III secretion system export apparatus subunit SctT [Paraburkholderia]ORC52422.1 EscT/YscT/HrcT family type III secretion system export apparatus protein [Burkholderia sp. A27]AXE96585.1 EscT/YscT/HrcT family type III secretion system export apparatus protein [Paraburkholderia terricola]MDR6409125.1 type III secretion protein T [Paraburkholderia terricola]MDR6448565.1 type III secretion protein T [Paraburkholderia terricola]MDR6482612.1 type III secretion protein T [Parabu